MRHHEFVDDVIDSIIVFDDLDRFRNGNAEETTIEGPSKKDAVTGKEEMMRNPIQNLSLMLSAVLAIAGFNAAMGETGGTCTGPSAGIGSNGNGTMTCGGGCSEQDWVWTVGGEVVGTGSSSVITGACDVPTDDERPVTNGCCGFAWHKDPTTGKYDIAGTIGGCSMTPCNPGFCTLNSAKTDASCIVPQG